MGSDPNASGLKSPTTDELIRLWVEACRSWAANVTPNLLALRTWKLNWTFATRACPFI
jgi:hypothetical protein